MNGVCMKRILAASSRLFVLVSAFVSVLLVSSGVASAATANEYYVYNGFGPVSSAFQKIALIFSDNSYLVFFTCFAVLAITFGAAAAYARMMGGGNGGYLTWMLPVIFGTMIYLGAFVPKTHIEIYDAVLNQNVSVNGVPVGIVYTATMLNHIERALVDIVNTSAPVGRDYTLTAGGIGIDLLGKTVTNTVRDANASRTMGEFVQKCVMFELTRPGTTLSMQSLLVTTGGATILDAMADAQNPAVYTVDYIADPVGTPDTCTAVYNTLKTYYTSTTNMNQALSSACGAAGIDPTDGAAVARCQGIVSDTASNTFGTTVDAATVVSNATIATITADYLKNSSAQVATELSAATNIAQGGAAEGFTSIFNSISRSAFTAFVIALIPLVALFIPTPLCKNALAMIFGLFVWVIVWNICELVVHHFFMDYYYRTVTSVTNAGFGIQAMLDIPSYTSVTMGTFGKLKAGAAGFATVVTGGILKFGGSEMSHFAARMGQTVSGSQAMMTGTTGRAAALGEHQHKQEQLAMARMSAPWTNQGAIGMDQMATGKAAMMAGRAAQGMGMLNASGGNPALMQDNTTAIGTVDTAQKLGKALNMSPGEAFKSGAVSAETIKGGLMALGANHLTEANQNAYIETMQKTAGNKQYNDMVGEYAKKSGIDMNTESGRKMAFEQFAALNLASNRALMEAFSDRDSAGNMIKGSAVKNYQQFQEMSHGKQRGEMDGAALAFAGAKANGFQGDWRSFYAVQSQMEGTNRFENADTWRDIADKHYGGNAFKMFSDIQKVQNTQAAGNATGMLMQEQEAMKQGVAGVLGKGGYGLDEKTLGMAQEAYRTGGVSAMESVLAKSEWGQQNPSLVGQAAKEAHNAAISGGMHAVSQAGGEMNFLGNKGRAQTFWNTADKEDFAKLTGNALSKDLGANVDAVATMFQQLGMGPREAAAFIRSHDEMKSVAGYQEAEKFAQAHNKGFVDLMRTGSRVFSMSLSDKEAQSWLGKGAKGGQYSVAVGDNGKMVFRDEKSGNQFQRGTFGKDGRDVIHYDREGKEIGRWKHSEYGSTTKSGDFVDIVQKDGTEIQGAGITIKDPKAPGGERFVLTNGSEKQVINRERVEDVKDKDGTSRGSAVVSRKGDKTEGNVAVSADASTKYDASKTSIFGEAIISQQTLSAAASDGSLSGGGVAQGIAIGERAVSVASEKVGQAGTLVTGPRKIASPNGGIEKAERKVEQEARDATRRAETEARDVERRAEQTQREATRDAERRAEQAARDAERRAEQQAREQAAEQARKASEAKTRTSRTLQNQSRTSNLPHSGSRPPVKNVNRGGPSKPRPAR